ncbi:choice-of-anchor Q domain-containing protein [Tahibacter caeni]|uniref:choice-of-anchor Q domain-containing protein n=1 Tax=Tahibacter caeni TaxID=1453545 RepID=UPI0021497095|nr:choice-of-anchor Q domain-containing protein [Tahibacter caeni]
MFMTITRRASGARRVCARLLSTAALLPAVANAATFTVTTTADGGAGSLRDALDQANRTAGADTVAFTAGLTGTVVLTSGAIDIFDAVTISGPGAARLRISGNNASRIFRIGPTEPGNVFAATISGLSLTDGNSADEGGAIFVDDSDLTVSNCVFRNNTAQRGGGLYAFPSGSTTLAVRDTRFETNSASADGGGFGAQDIDAVVIDKVVATGNTAARSGGGAFLRAVGVTITSSDFSNNTASTLAPAVVGITGGGGLRIDGSKATATASITATRLVGNTSQKGQGGALWITALPPDVPPTVAAATLDRVQVSGNTADLAGGGIHAAYINTTLTAASLAGNTAQQAGGGIAFQSAGALDLVNTTIAGNTSALATGGGVYSAAGTSLAVASSTFAGNGAASGGGIARDGSGATLRNSIVANNNAPSAPDLAGSFTSNYTLVKNIGGASLAGGSGNLTGVDPLLGALAMNGGLTLSLLPAAGSPALNAGDPAGSGLAATDQRGLPRIAGGRIDLGAAERQSPEDVIFRTGF